MSYIRSAAFPFINILETRRLFAAHTPDVAWGNAGFQNLAGPGYLSLPSDNGKVMVVERLSDYKGIRVARLNNDGSTDTSFGSNGYGPTLTFEFADLYDAIKQPDGKLLVTGGDILFVARFNADGTIDTSFGTGGIAKPLELSQGTQPTFPLGGLMVQSNGKIIAAGYISQQLQDHNAQFTALYRFNADGTPDTSFGEQGRLIVNIENVHPQLLATRSNDRIFLAASQGNLFQYTADGSPDLSFSDDGMTNIETMMGDEDILSAVPLSNGKILLGGSSYEWAGMPTNQWQSGLPMILRLNADGSLDTTFAKDGFFHNNYGGGGFMENITAMTVDADGRILASGTKNPGKFDVYALTSDGALDTQFAPDGVIRADYEFYPNDIIVQADGKVLITGGGAKKTGVVARISIPAPVALGANGILYIRGTEAADTITIQPDSGQTVASVNGEDFEFSATAVKSCQIEGFAGDDVISATSAIDCVVNPGAGNDSVTTSIGNDKITEPEMGSGKDTIRSSDGNDTIYTGDGDDRVIAGSGKMDIRTWTGNDYVTAGDGAMYFELSSGDDRLVTGQMNFSTIKGGYGNDNITTFGSVFIQAGEGYKSLKWNPTLPDDDTITATGGRVRVDLDGGNNTCTIISRFPASVGGGTGNDLITTGSGNDHIDPIGGNDTVYSNGGDDYILQLGDTDYVDAGSGNDSISTGTRGAAKNTTVLGGAGNDSIYAGGGGVVYGGSGNDGISAARPPGNVPIDTSISLEAHGQGGNDTIIGSDGRDKLYGGDGDDWLRGGMSADKLFGGAGNDKLSGNGGSDMLLGDVGNDTLFGNVGDDKLYSKDGEIDTVDGGDGSDIYDSDTDDVIPGNENAG